VGRSAEALFTRERLLLAAADQELDAVVARYDGRRARLELKPLRARLNRWRNSPALNPVRADVYLSWTSLA